MPTPEYTKKWIAERIAKGLCIRCPANARPDKRLCADCQEDANNATSADRSRAILEGKVKPVGRKPWHGSFYG